MTSRSISYPAGPPSVNPELIKPSKSYAEEAAKATNAIVLFVMAYLGLILVALMLVAVCIVAAIVLVYAIPRIIVFIAGLGLVGFGLLTFFFLIKFVFANKKTDRSEMLEVTEQEQPELFSMVRQLATEIQTQFPKKIYFVADVNAFVFYDSSFWSMFFPVKKNLAIGLGLVQSLNISELKAVIAHEFGHFSQKTMRQGSYIYQFNQVIHNLLYENEGYQGLLQAFANTHGIFAIMANMTVQVVKVIVEIMQNMHGWINKQNLALSREMEFHADTVAASVSGSNNLVSSLRRLEVANVAYQNIIQYYNQVLPKKEQASNAFVDHRYSLQLVAKSNRLSVENGLPIVNGPVMEQLLGQRVMYKDQWASHPSLKDREANLNALNLEAPVNEMPAIELIQNQAELEKYFTDLLYQGVPVENKGVFLDETQVREALEKKITRYDLPEIFAGFYDQRVVSTFDLPEPGSNHPVSDQSVASFFLENGPIPAHIQRTQDAINVLTHIAEGHISIPTFDLDGKRYPNTEASNLVSRLTEELAKSKENLIALDKEAFMNIFSRISEENQSKLIAAYQEMYFGEKELLQKMDKYDEIFNAILPLLRETAGTEELVQAENLIQSNEAELKEELKLRLSEPLAAEILTADQIASLGEFLESSYTYTSVKGNDYFVDQIHALAFALNQLGLIIGEMAFEKRKKSLRIQAELL